MGTFHSIDELIKTLDREKVLLKEMFAKRHSLQFRYDYALEMTEYKEERIRYLIENGVIRDTGDCLGDGRRVSEVLRGCAGSERGNQCFFGA